jgi:hypothetical protein
MEEKWFYPLQKIAEGKINDLYPDAVQILNYQEVTETRVFEQRTISTDPSFIKEVIVIMRKSPSAVFVYELNVVASN